MPLVSNEQPPASAGGALPGRSPTPDQLRHRGRSRRPWPAPTADRANGRPSRTAAATRRPHASAATGSRVPPPLPPRARPRRRTLLSRRLRGASAWLWVALAAVVVLGVGTATTLAVVRPWEGDTADRDRDRLRRAAEDSEPARAGRADATCRGSTPTRRPHDHGVRRRPCRRRPTRSPATSTATASATRPPCSSRGDDVERVVLSSTGVSFQVDRAAAAGPRGPDVGGLRR